MTPPALQGRVGGNLKRERLEPLQKLLSLARVISLSDKPLVIGLLKALELSRDLTALGGWHSLLEGFFRGWLGRCSHQYL